MANDEISTFLTKKIDLLVRRRPAKPPWSFPDFFTFSLPGRISASRCPIFKISTLKRVNFLPATTSFFFTTSSERPFVSKIVAAGLTVLLTALFVLLEVKLHLQSPS